MDIKDIKKHWDGNAKVNSTSLLSTTKTPTIKTLEINAFSQEIAELIDATKQQSIIEIGCGNGYNLFGLEEQFPNLEYHGADYSQEMIEAAFSLRDEKPKSKINFSVADALSIPDHSLKSESYDFVISNRMLINLSTWSLQKQALRNLSALLKPEGYLIIIENFNNSYANQNTLRELIGLPARVPVSYNTFIEEGLFENFVENDIGLKILKSNNFASLHDLLLYVLLPHINSGSVAYDHPLMQSTTELLTQLPKEFSGCFGNFGQNNLYVMKRI